MASRKREQRRGVVRREGRPRQRLSPELEELARGDTDRLRGPRRAPRIKDDRPVALVRGVANRDARAVFDARLARLEADVAARDSEPDARERLARGLREARALRIWRGRSLTGLDAMAEQLLGLSADETIALSGDAPDLSDEAIAIWIRAEAGLLAEGIDGRVWIDESERLHVALDARAAPNGMRAIAAHLGQLRGDWTPASRNRDERGPRDEG